VHFFFSRHHRSSLTRNRPRPGPRNMAAPVENCCRRPCDAVCRLSSCVCFVAAPESTYLGNFVATEEWKGGPRSHPFRMMRPNHHPEPSLAQHTHSAQPRRPHGDRRKLCQRLFLRSWATSPEPALLRCPIGRLPEACRSPRQQSSHRRAVRCKQRRLGASGHTRPHRLRVNTSLCDFVFCRQDFAMSFWLHQ